MRVGAVMRVALLVGVLGCEEQPPSPGPIQAAPRAPKAPPGPPPRPGGAPKVTEALAPEPELEAPPPLPRPWDEAGFLPRGEPGQEPAFAPGPAPARALPEQLPGPDWASLAVRLATAEPGPWTVRLYRLASAGHYGREEWERVAEVEAAGGAAALRAPRGLYLVVARLAGQPRAWRWVEVAGPAELPVPLDIPAPERQAGLAQVGGRGAPGAQVELLPEPRGLVGPIGLALAPAEERLHFQADDAGWFELAAPPGPYQLEVVARAGAASAGQSVALPEARGAFWELGVAQVVRGTVLRADGSPAAQAWVSAAGEQTVRVQADARGRFALGLGPGDWAIEAGDGDAEARYAGRYLVGELGQPPEFTVPLRPAARFAGQVRDPQGHPVAGASVVLISSAAALWQRPSGRGAVATTNAEGWFAIAGVPAGRYDLAAFGPGGRPTWRRGLAVLPGQTFPASVDLQPGRVAEGVAHDPGGKPVAGLWVEAGHGATRTGADGAYRLEGLDDNTPATAHQPGSLIDQRLDIPVAPLATVQARVRPPAGAGDAPVRVNLEFNQGGWASLVVRPGVPFRFQVPAGEYQLRVTALVSQEYGLRKVRLHPGLNDLGLLSVAKEKQPARLVEQPVDSRFAPQHLFAWGLLGAKGEPKVEGFAIRDITPRGGCTPLPDVEWTFVGERYELEEESRADIAAGHVFRLVTTDGRWGPLVLDLAHGVVQSLQAGPPPEVERGSYGLRRPKGGVVIRGTGEAKGGGIGH